MEKPKYRSFNDVGRFDEDGNAEDEGRNAEDNGRCAEEQTTQWME